MVVVDLGVARGQRQRRLVGLVHTRRRSKHSRLRRNPDVRLHTIRSPRGVGWLDGAWRDDRLVIPWVCKSLTTDVSADLIEMIYTAFTKFLKTQGSKQRWNEVAKDWKAYRATFD